MATIKTNYNTEKHFVLTNNEDKIMAIIHCPAGKNDISEKITKAISEYENAERFTLANSFLMNRLSCVFIVKTLIVYDGKREENSIYYNLTEACLY